MPRIELQQLLRPTTTPEQEILLTHFYNQFDNRSAANRQIINVESLFYQGAIAGTEFLVYAATKLYICYNMNLNNLVAEYATYPHCLIYDEGNNLINSVSNTVIGWNGIAFNRAFNNIITYNFYFSRIGVIDIARFSFNGYRITLI